MKKLKIIGKSFMDFYLLPLIVCFTVIVIPVAIVKYKHSFPTAVKITEGIALLAIIIAVSFWLQKFIRIPVPPILRDFIRIVLTFLYGLLTILIYWGIAVIGLGIFYKREYLFYKVNYYIAAIIAFTSGAFPYRKGDFTKIADGIAKIIIMNHASFIDYVLTVLVMGYKQKWKVVIGKNLLKYWPFSQYAKRLGIFIERGNDGSDTVVVRQIIKALEDGYNVLIFAGGGRDRPGEIRDFDPGVFSIALKRNAPVIPVALYNTGKYCPAGPRSKNQTGEVPKGFWSLLKYRLDAGVDVIILFLQGKANHLLVSPRPLKMQIFPEMNLVRTDGTKKTPLELSEETHAVIHRPQGNVE
jgi:1-acyl-sn-glycerol-3-phosphate acyltransferase